MDERERKEIERQIRVKAVRRARAKVGFRWHLVAFVLVNALLGALNFAFSPAYLWIVWPFAGWGIALALHAFAVFQGAGVSEDMVEAEVRREMARRQLT